MRKVHFVVFICIELVLLICTYKTLCLTLCSYPRKDRFGSEMSLIAEMKMFLKIRISSIRYLKFIRRFDINLVTLNIIITKKFSKIKI